MRFILALALFMPIAALAQSAPITLSGAEYDRLVAALAQRDPVIGALMQRQSEAQKEAAEKGDKPTSQH